MSFSPEQNYWFIPQYRLKIPRGFEMIFWLCPAIYREFALQNARDVFPLSHRHAFLQRETSDLQKVFGLGVHPTPLPHPDASHQFWVHMAVDSGCKISWYGRFYEKQITTWRYMKLSVDRLQGLVSVLHLCQHPCASYNYDASKGKPRRDVACACDAS